MHVNFHSIDFRLHLYLLKIFSDNHCTLWFIFGFHRSSYIYVCHFSLARRWCTVPQVIRAMLILLAVAILHQSTRFFDRKFLPIKYVLDEKIFEGCEYHTSEWVSVIFYFIYLYIYLSFICHRTNKKIYFRM